MIRNDYASLDSGSAPGISKGVHYALVTAALVVGLVVGSLSGVSLKNRQTDELRFGRDLSAISGATVTLELVDQGQRERIQKVQQNLLAMNTNDAFAKLPAMKRLPLPNAQLTGMLGRSIAYAQRHKMADAARQLTAIQQRIVTQPAP